jgi:pimeloyl-ACP methyl ester carboxylesterase
MWQSLSIDELDVRCLFIDLPGHGQSEFSMTESPASGIEKMAIEVIAVIESLGIENFDILGHSMGGYVALEVKRLKTQCEKVVLLNSNFWVDPPAKVIDRKRIAKLVEKAKTFFLQKAIPGLFADPNKFQMEMNQLISDASSIESSAIAYASLAMASRKDFTKLIYPQDLYVIHGVQDRLVSSEQFEGHGILNGHFFELQKAGHMSHIESPEEVIEVLKVILGNPASDSNTGA